jgi:hypothetical protein
MAKINLTLDKYVTYGDRSRCVIRPGIVANFYVASKVRGVGPLLADTLERYVQFVGRKAAAFYLAENGSMKPLDDRRLQRDLKLLRRLPDTVEGFDWFYSEIGDGGVGDHLLHLSNQEPNAVFPGRDALVHFAFPADAIERYGRDRLVAFLFGEAKELGIESGNIGWGLVRGIVFEDQAIAEANKLLPRFLGFDPCYPWAHDYMREHTAWAHWANLLHPDLFSACGGKAALTKSAPDAQLEKHSGFFAIWGSKLPPIGDANRGAPDLGCLPGVARFLKPKRVPLTGLGDDKLDAPAWLARFDSLPNKPWDNS